MKKKAAYFLLGFIVLAIGLFGYHCYAASDAEQTLNESIQQLSGQTDPPLTVTYSAIDVNPFTGDILFSDINIIRDKNIQRAGTARFDLTYTDFLNIAIWGTESGLRQIETGMLELENLSYTNRTTLLEVKVDSLRVNYRGNLWNLIVLGITRQPAAIKHAIDLEGYQFTLSQPPAARSVGIINADSLKWSTLFGKQSSDSDTLESRFSLADIVWSPPSDIQNRYQFFIQGFGYKTDSIPMKQVEAIYHYESANDRILIRNMTFDSELFTITLRGWLVPDPGQFEQTRLNGLSVEIDRMSPRFKNFIDQLKKISGLNLPGDEKKIQFTVNGTLSAPKIAF